MQDKESESKVFTPLDPRWDDYTHSLCIHLMARPTIDDGLICNCDGSFRLTRNILASRYPEIDIEATIDYFRKMEWYCDCQIFIEQHDGLSKDHVQSEIHILS